ncbi:hypothetical protein ACIQ6V_27840 [Streptomyces sp. NPDC096198]|uniref:hypothetical protein n=1 Tax=Streptomyces sp. NPDC096198 TaxID=3366080 RepID=UPI0037F65E4C
MTPEPPWREDPAGPTGHAPTLPGLGGTADRAADAVAAPLAAARRALTARHGLPLYAGLGALAVVGVLEWPLAVGLGVGYAVLRTKGEPDRTTTPPRST